MDVSQAFSTVVRRLVIAFLVILVAAFAGVVSDSHLRQSIKGTASLPTSHLERNIGAQNAGNVGIYTREVPVFSSQASGASSSILPDFGFASQSLFVVTSNFTGTIDLEWSPTGAAPFYSLVMSTYANDTGNHSLQLGGYWPNLRSTMTRSVGSLSAWYTASAAPISYFPPAIGSNGATAPFQCDQYQTSHVVTNGSYFQVASSSTRGFAICGFTVSFAGATSTQTDGVQVGFDAACAGGGTYPWFITTTANTPQLINVGSGLGALFQAPFPNTAICVGNHSGASLEISIWYALI